MEADAVQDGETYYNRALYFLNDVTGQSSTGTLVTGLMKIDEVFFFA